MAKKAGAIEKNSYCFGLRIVRLYEYLSKKKQEYVLSKQLLRCGTSVGAMVRESQNAESRKDFIHKLGIAQKECDESIYWIRLLHDGGFLSDHEYESIVRDAEALLKMIRSAILTTKDRTKTPNNS